MLKIKSQQYTNYEGFLQHKNLLGTKYNQTKINVSQTLLEVIFLSTFTTDATGKLDVFWHDGHPLCMDGTQVGVFKQSHQVSFGSFLECSDGCTLETQVSFEILSNLSDQPLEWQFADQKLSGLLVFTDLTKSYSTCKNNQLET